MAAAPPRKPHMLAEIFTHAHSLDIKNRNSWALLEAAAETTGIWEGRKLFVKFVTAKRLVCKNGHSLVEPPSRVFYTVSVPACLFVSERFFQKVYWCPLASPSPFTLLARQSAGRRFVWEEVRIDRFPNYCLGARRGKDLVAKGCYGPWHILLNVNPSRFPVCYSV